MKISALVALSALLALPVLAADKDQVAAAIKKLADQSYSWKTTVTVPASSQFSPGPTEGKIAKDGTTHVVSSFGENKIQTALKGGKAAMTNREGEWQSAADLESAEGGGRWMASMARNFKAPAAQATDALGYVKELKKEGDAFTGALSEEGVKAMLSFRRGNAEPPAVTSPSGSAKFWVKDGVLSKYEVHVKGTMKNRDGEDVERERTTTVEFKDVGKTSVELPQEAQKKLG